jgi:hypothetical protein
MSEEDIQAGAQWFDTVADALRASSFAVICVTPQNLQSEWLHFEAGAIGMSHSGTGERPKVAPYLVGVRKADVRAPLSLYQAQNADLTGTWQLVRSMNASLPDALAEDRLSRSFEKWWPELERQLEAASMEAETTAAMVSAESGSAADYDAGRAVEDMVAEVLELVRELGRGRQVMLRPSLRSYYGSREARMQAFAIELGRSLEGVMGFGAWERSSGIVRISTTERLSAEKIAEIERLASTFGYEQVEFGVELEE